MKNVLKEIIRRLSGMNSKNDCPNGTNCDEKAAKWTGGDLNPNHNGVVNLNPTSLILN